MTEQYFSMAYFRDFMFPVIFIVVLIIGVAGSYIFESIKNKIDKREKAKKNEDDNFEE